MTVGFEVLVTGKGFTHLLFKSSGVSALFQDPFYPAECVHTCMVVHVYSVNMAVYKGVCIHLNSCGVASFILCELGVNGSPFQACLAAENHAIDKQSPKSVRCCTHIVQKL